MRGTETRNPSAVDYRKPTVQDGQDIWRLIKRAGGLDLNSAYCYLMLCDMFSETCCIAERDGRLSGFLSAFRKPEEPDTLFVWQIAVDPVLRGNGIGGALLKEVLSRSSNKGIRYLEATISPGNIASRSLFMAMARGLECECKISELYEASMFPDNHEIELIYRIGPFSESK
ncbi:diaminobutyrate acetyltransferase [Paenibacillus sp. 1011MAR3C5]|uniref:diaminobutyrate acetyltransferase n=1 Tax=Paenibacillus sp. 1011MAR3C5 TaxID=1675787 RepID=UPI000E6C4C71|nr:diaminobutyrate acetyltransferase [Paenibacillus sp. 1011MAR3C5]RJE90243.1 diaminobutyrate acetyltransferase [Paenibacillus sp. 1011MAR3C5]